MVKKQISELLLLEFNDKWGKVHTSDKNVCTTTLDTFIESKNLQNEKYILCLRFTGRILRIKR